MNSLKHFLQHLDLRLQKLLEDTRRGREETREIISLADDIKSSLQETEDSNES